MATAVRYREQVRSSGPVIHRRKAAIMTQQTISGTLELPPSTAETADLPKPVHEVTWTLPWVAVMVPLILAGLGIAALVSR